MFTDTLELDLGTVEPSLAGPKRPQDRVPLSKSKAMFREALDADLEKLGTLARRSRLRAGDGGAARAAALAAAVATDAEGDGRSTSGVTVEYNGADVHAAARRGRDRGDHELHEHVESVRDARRRAARAERRAEGAQRRSRG